MILIDTTIIIICTYFVSHTKIRTEKILLIQINDKLMKDKIQNTYFQNKIKKIILYLGSFIKEYLVNTFSDF